MRSRAASWRMCTLNRSARAVSCHTMRLCAPRTTSVSFSGCTSLASCLYKSFVRSFIADDVAILYSEACVLAESSINCGPTKIIPGQRDISFVSLPISNSHLAKVRRRLSVSSTTPELLDVFQQALGLCMSGALLYPEPRWSWNKRRSHGICKCRSLGRHRST